MGNCALDWLCTSALKWDCLKNNKEDSMFSFLFIAPGSSLNPKAGIILHTDMSYKTKRAKKTHASSIENRCTTKHTHTQALTLSQWNIKSQSNLWRTAVKLGNCEKALL